MLRTLVFVFAFMFAIMPVAAYSEDGWIDILAGVQPADVPAANKGTSPAKPPPFKDIVHKTSSPKAKAEPAKTTAAPAAKVVASPPATAAKATGGEPVRLAFQIDNNYGRWKGDTSPLKSGIQNITYGSIGIEQGNFGAAVYGSFVDTVTRYSQASQPDFALGTPLDTTVIAYYKMPSLFGYQARFGLDVSLPTGKTEFNSTDVTAILVDNIASELYLAPSFGQGLNVAPNIGIAIPFGNTLKVGLGFRYEVTGDYNPTADTANDNYNPGDIFSIITSVEYNMTESSLLLLDMSAVYSTRDRQGGADVFKQGDLYSTSLQYAVSYGDIRTTYGLSFSTQMKNQSSGTGGVTTENRNSNGNLTEGFVNLFVPFSSSFAGTLVANYKTVASNGYVSSDALYDAGYSIYSGTAGLVYELVSDVAITATVKYYQLANKADVLETVNTTYQGYNFDVGIIYSF